MTRFLDTKRTGLRFKNAVAEESVDEVHAALEILYRSFYVPRSTLASDLSCSGEARLERARHTRLELPIWMKF
jgi:hypothetical protein